MGWGFESCDFDFSQVDTLKVVLVKAVFFYIREGARFSFPINNSWPVHQGKDRVDNDFAKKAETNTMSKALSKLGFSADVFMGQFDDFDYQQVVGNEFALKKAEDKVEEQSRQEEDRIEWINNTVKCLHTAVSLHELQMVFKRVVRKANLTQDKVAVGKFDNAKNKRKVELEENEAAQ